ncbi:tRNA pseudouridine(13) synthase TruD [bacterium]|nr:tRNA pseudouridine(13) synthase TruD [bacterium]
MLPFISASVPGIGGSLRCCPEDFIVQELPAYEPCGDGEHLILEITKRQITTQAIANELARLLNCPLDAIGFAGMKDRQAVTTQRFSVPATVNADALADCSAQVRILGQHRNKLRKGHLLGNRFRIRVRNSHPDWEKRCQDISAILSAHGFPNFYGPQRFGREGSNAAIGEKALKTGKLFGPKWRKWLMISALQSQLFNEYLVQRINDGMFETALEGDVFGHLPRGGVFVSLEPDKEQPRLDQFEISPMGPIFGYKMMPAQNQAAIREQAILEAHGLNLSDFRSLKAEGSRRRMRLRPENFSIEKLDGDPVFCFDLPSGTYATILLNEFMKTDSGSDEEIAED